jgi:hypothetical protein
MKNLRQRVDKDQRKEASVHKIDCHEIAIGSYSQVALGITNRVVVRRQRLGYGVKQRIENDSSNDHPE